MKIHEHQAKALLRTFGVAVPRGDVAADPAQARRIAEGLGGRVVVKAQIHAGGRGKSGGVKVAASAPEAESLAGAMLGMRLVTPQTGPEGKVVQRVLIEEALERDREMYLGLVIDRSSERPVLIASSAGGMEIEEVAAKTPELILKQAIHPAVGFQPYQGRALAFGLGLKGPQVGQAVAIIGSLCRAFHALDASLAEINPLVTTRDGAVLALDAKINLDDNALHRHPELKELRDLSEEEPLEVEASAHGLNYIKLSGNVGCMVNGAGLAMATMDIIKLAGGEPANFLDVGGGATAEQVTSAFRIILSDEHVRAVLINIFGGIMRCDVVAQGVVQAASQVGVKVPVVVRLEGTNKEEGQRILTESGLNFTVADGMKDAAEKVVRLAGAAGGAR
ncbi:MAG TPA: ADP-forming succinate--CoA ligase subunit beta [Candidatus Polarisedimenticolia bacterium]|nr:ADP-forming succinate--CoA ligase subunit beta [Candidatus Polarisedimenticolia bacterium]